MFNYYLKSDSYTKASLKSIETNLQDLNDIVVESKMIDDSFYKHESIWYIQTAEGEFGEVVFSKLEDKQLSNIILPKLFNAIDSLQKEIITFDEFDAFFKTYNAFYGINFSDIDPTRCITNKDSYSSFRKKHLWELAPQSFWERRESLFSNIILCDSVENDIKTIGGTYLEQILVKLKELDKYTVVFWKDGAFNYDDANSKAPLNISPESKKTMEQVKYFNQRVFSLPDGRRECFELHIKTGNLRFHFLPENGKIFIGYIGKHLDTDKHN